MGRAAKKLRPALTTNQLKAMLRLRTLKSTLSVLLPFIVSGAMSHASAQGSRKDDIVFGPTGRPVAGATVRVCQSGATGSPCTPLATIYTDATLTTTTANPLQTDGIGNYHFYAPAGRYEIQIAGQGITGTMTYPDVILAPDVTSTGTGNNISAFGLTLGGNLSVAGNATIAGTLTTSTFSPGSFVPSSLTVSGNSSVAGPRPYIDVTAPPYNADPTGTTDATAAIQSAITAACSYNFPSHPRPGVFLPPGLYAVTQTQTGTSSTAPIFTLCHDLYVFSNGSQADSGQFQAPPQGAAIFVNPGPSPNNAPAFLVSNSGGGSGVNSDFNDTFENLSIRGYNQAMWIQSTSVVRLNNVYLIARVTGQPDNTPLKISNTLWVYIDRGGLEVGSPTVPTMLMTGEAPLAGEGQYVSQLFITDLNTTGGGFQYVQRASAPTLAEGWVFRNITQENVNQPFVSVTETSGGMLPGVLGVEMDSVEQADSSDLGNPLIYMNIAGYMQNLTIHNSLTQEPNATAVTVGGGTLRNYFNDSGQLVSDSSGNPVGTGFVLDGSLGMDFTSPSTGGYAVHSCVIYFSNCGTVIANRWFTNGSRFSTVGIDASTGVLFGDGVTYGYTSGLK